MTFVADLYANTRLPLTALVTFGGLGFEWECLGRLPVCGVAHALCAKPTVACVGHFDFNASGFFTGLIIASTGVRVNFPNGG